MQTNDWILAGTAMIGCQPCQGTLHPTVLGKTVPTPLSSQSARPTDFRRVPLAYKSLNPKKKNTHLGHGQISMPCAGQTLGAFLLVHHSMFRVLMRELGPNWIQIDPQDLVLFITYPSILGANRF
jgi:hypothetical protein